MSRTRFTAFTAAVFASAGAAGADSFVGFGNYHTGAKANRIGFGDNAMTISAECFDFTVYEYGVNAPAGAFYGQGMNTPIDTSAVSYDKFISPGWFPFTEGHHVDFIFDKPVESFGFTTIDLLEACVSEDSYLTLLAFGKDGKIIGAMNREGAQGNSGLTLDWEVGGYDQLITRARLIGNLWEGAAGGYDDFFITDSTPGPLYVPAPAALTLAALPLGALGLRRRR